MSNERHDYVIKLTWDERQMIQSLLDSAMEGGRNWFDGDERGILQSAHTKVSAAQPTKASVRRCHPRKSSPSLRGLRGK